MVAFYSAKHEKFEAAVEYPEELCGWNVLSEIEGMFEQMLSILLFLGDPTRAGALLGGGKAFIAAFMPRAIRGFVCSQPWGFEVWLT